MSQRFSAESVSNEMILVRTLVFILFYYYYYYYCKLCASTQHTSIQNSTDGMESDNSLLNQTIKTDVETKLRMRIRSTEHLVDPKGENMAASCFLG